MNFEHNIVEYAAYTTQGGKAGFLPWRMRCVCCAAAVGGASYITIDLKRDPPQQEKLLIREEWSNIRRVDAVLADGTLTRLTYCADCVSSARQHLSDPSIREKISTQMRNMEKDAMAATGKKPDEETSRLIDEQFRVIGFAEGDSLPEKMSNANKLKELHALAK